MQLKSFLIVFIALLSFVLIYMLVTHEIPIFFQVGGSGYEVVTLNDKPFRFTATIVIVAALCGYLIRKIKNL